LLGKCLINRLRDKQITNETDLREILRPQSDIGAGKWFDLAGLFMPEKEVEKLLSDIENEDINTLEQTEQVFRRMFESYSLYEWTYVADVLQKLSDKTTEEITSSDIIELITKCRDAFVNFNNQLIQDAGKEFSPNVQF